MFPPLRKATACSCSSGPNLSLPVPPFSLEKVLSSDGCSSWIVEIFWEKCWGVSYACNDLLSCFFPACSYQVTHLLVSCVTWPTLGVRQKAKQLTVDLLSCEELLHPLQSKGCRVCVLACLLVCVCKHLHMDVCVHTYASQSLHWKIGHFNRKTYRCSFFQGSHDACHGLMCSCHYPACICCKKGHLSKRNICQ